MLIVKHLCKYFGALKAVHNLSFELEAGKICGFVGPNGAGKTTAMRMIATLEEPTAGYVEIEGHSLMKDPYLIRKLIGFMPDHYGAYPAMTVDDYLQFYARAYGLEAGRREKRINALIEFTGLGSLTERLVEVLSKGQRQRLNLARALINDPKLLIMDEPAAGLDPRARVELRFLMKSLADQGKAIFVSSHILSELSELCDNMLIIDSGKLITYGSFEQIRAQLQEKLEINIKLISEEAVEQAERFLVERADIESVQVGENGSIRFAINGEERTIPALIRDLLNEDIPVMEFRPQMLTMEDVFIQITEGDES